MIGRSATSNGGTPGAPLSGQHGGSAPLVAPVAVRMLDLEAPLSDLHAPLNDLRVGRSGSRPTYRSLLVVAHLGGEPVGTATFSLAEGRPPSGDQLADRLCWRFAEELREANARRDRRPGGVYPRLPFATVVDREGVLLSLLPTVSVVVPTCSNPRALERCVRSILASAYDEFEVIVVENRPGAGDTRAMLDRHFRGEPRLRYTEEPSRGASRARNAGLALAQGAIVAFTDDDVVVDRGWIAASVEAFRGADDIACVTGLILPLELESESQVLLEQFAGFGKGFRRKTYRHPESRAEIPFFPYAPGAIGSGANTVVRADVARELGGFDTVFGPGTPTTGGEDLDLYIRLLCAGHAVAYEPSAIVWHQHPDGAARLRRQVYRYGIGLGALLAKQLIAGPDRPGFVQAVPAGIRYARDPQSRKNAGKPPGYPRRLGWLERLGVLLGPAAYLLSAGISVTRRAAGVGRSERARPRRAQRPHVQPGGGVATPAWLEGPATLVRRVRSSTRSTASTAPSRAECLALGAAATCAAAALSVALDLPSAMRAAALLAFLCLAPGIALLTAARGRAEPGLVLGIGLGTAAVVAQSMLWLGEWRPRLFLYALCGVCLVVLAPSLEAFAQSPLGEPARAARRRLRRAIEDVSRGAVMHLIVIVMALAVWAVSLLGTHLDRMGGLGLLQAMPPTYFLAFGFLLIGFSLGASNDSLDPKLLGLYALALVVVLHATTAVLYSEPRYAWVYKHLGVINLIGSTGKADRTVDIYNNWPSFFAANAWLRDTSGLAPIAYAGWAQLFFNLANVAVVRFALRAVTRDERLLWSATVLFVLGNWVGQDYLAPQAFGFVLSLVVIGLWLRCGPPIVNSPYRGGRWPSPRLRRLAWGWLPSRIGDDQPAAVPLGQRAALLAGATCFLAVLTSHQLSPAFLILSVGCLAVFRRRVRYRPRRVRLRVTGNPGRHAVLSVLGGDRVPGGASEPQDDRAVPGLRLVAVMVAAEVWWVVLAWPFVRQHFGLIEPSAGTAPSRGVTSPLPGAAFTFYAPAAVVGAITVLALIGLIRRVRMGKRDLVPASLIIAPLLGVAVQSYGGEGPFRAYLFALPWLALLATFACARWPSPIRKAHLSLPRLMAATPAIGAFLLVAYFGQELANRIPTADVAASTWYERHAPAGSLRINLAPNAPNRLTARYPLVSLADPPSLLEQPGFAGHVLGAADVPRLERLIRQLGHHRAYVVLSDSQENYARLNGLSPSGSVTSFVSALVRSRQFRLVYERPGVWIFQYSPTPDKPSAGS